MSVTVGFLLFTFVLASLSGQILHDHPVRRFFKTGLAIAAVIPLVSFFQGGDPLGFTAAMVLFDTCLMAGAIAIARGMPSNSGLFRISFAFRVVMFASAMTTFVISGLVWTLFFA